MNREFYNPNHNYRQRDDLDINGTLGDKKARLWESPPFFFSKVIHLSMNHLYLSSAEGMKILADVVSDSMSLPSDYTIGETSLLE